jgi:hypothetical protein
MAVDHIRYDILAQEALRGVMRTVLADAAQNGLPGDHHFYITFATPADGVRMSARLRQQYPQEMTIILQHQFWDLTVNDEGFEVGLSFGGIPERLAIPFEAVTAFFDPSVQFGLKFELAATEQPEAAPEEPAPAAGQRGGTARPPAEQQQPRAAPKTPAGPVPVAANPEPEKPGDEAPEKPEPPSGGEVVRLDRFRKK